MRCNVVGTCLALLLFRRSKARTISAPSPIYAPATPVRNFLCTGTLASQWEPGRGVGQGHAVRTLAWLLFCARPVVAGRQVLQLEPGHGVGQGHAARALAWLSFCVRPVVAGGQVLQLEPGHGVGQGHAARTLAWLLFFSAAAAPSMAEAAEAASWGRW